MDATYVTHVFNWFLVQHSRFAGLIMCGLCCITAVSFVIWKLLQLLHNSLMLKYCKFCDLETFAIVA